jgi:hypothetical protein
MTEQEIQGLARRWSAHVDGPRWAFVDALPAPLADTEREALFAWVRQRMAAYIVGARSMGIEWSAASENDHEDMADWISQDLGEDIYCGPLCEAAGWPS